MGRRVFVLAMILGFATTAWCREARSVPSAARDAVSPCLQGMLGEYSPLLTWSNWSIGLIVQPCLASYDPYDGSQEDGLNGGAWPVDAGLGALWRTKLGLLGLSAVPDALGRYRGRELELSYSRPFGLGGLEFFPSMGMRWKSQDLVDSWYGMKPDDRPGSAGSGSLDPFVRLSMRHWITPKWSLQASVQYEWLDGNPADNPIMNANHDASVMVGVAYSW